MKEYPPRKRIIKRSICVCGHPWHRHEVSNTGVFYSIFRKEEFHAGQCKDCMCPKFDFAKWEIS